ncbi:MAG: putative glycoside hydrolase [Rhodothermales bacterium]
MDRKAFLKIMSAGTVGLMGGSLLQCAQRPDAEPETAGPKALKNWTWMGGKDRSLDQWKQQFARIRAAGLDAVLLNIGIGEDQVEQLIPAAQDEGLEVHAWMVTMMHGGQEEAHHEWYAVNRNGVSTADDPPYVDYYKFMCPSREPVQRYHLKRAERLAEMKGLVSIHLDYIRYPDVILPVALWPKYGLVQDKEYPEFDFCYCEVCRDAFKQQTGLDPLQLEDPPSNEAWLQYRYDSITHVVNRMADAVHARGKQLTAAVFPTPDIARALVRQDWTRWNLDAVLPMMYHSFYNEDVAWVGKATREGVEALAGAFPLYSGLYIPALTPDELAQAAELALENGAGGVVLFEGWAPTEEHWTRLAAVLKA